jgi:hypothetical protein
MSQRSRRDSPVDKDMPVRTGIVLWRLGNATCTCHTVALDHIEITLTVNGVVAQSGRFDRHEEASRFAIDMRRAYVTR